MRLNAFFVFLSHLSMSKSLHITLLSALVLLFAACGGDGSEPLFQGGSGTEQGGAMAGNKNKNVVAPNLPKEITRLEFPHLNTENSIVLVHKLHETDLDQAHPDDPVNFSVEWDYNKKSQRWCCYQMHNFTGYVGYTGNFTEDPDLPTSMRFSDTNAMYKGSGFTRGHICPSGDRQYSKEANIQTFYYTNMQPQYYNFNGGENYDGLWVQMENQVRKWGKSLKAKDTLFVCKGGTIDKESQILTRIKGQLIVPKYFFMALLLKNSQGYRGIAFWTEHLTTTVPNADLSKYVKTIRELETLTGIDFFCNLPDEIENKVETTNSSKAWGL